MSSAWTFPGVPHEANVRLMCLMLGQYFAVGLSLAMPCMLLRSFDGRNAALLCLPADILVVSVRCYGIYTATGARYIQLYTHHFEDCSSIHSALWKDMTRPV